MAIMTDLIIWQKVLRRIKHGLSGNIQTYTELEVYSSARQSRTHNFRYYLNSPWRNYDDTILYR